jgi:tRNA(fMet)-specific endonuclease VapC
MGLARMGRLPDPSEPRIVGESGEYVLKRFLLDTGPAADFVNRRHGVYDRAKQTVASGGRIGICIPVLGELWAGVCGSATRQRNEQRLIRRLSELIVWPYDEAAARRFGEIFAELRRVGRPMQQIDVQIAAVALTLGDCTVITKDSDFLAVPGLTVEDWSIQ